MKESLSKSELTKRNDSKIPLWGGGLRGLGGFPSRATKAAFTRWRRNCILVKDIEVIPCDTFGK